ncbi:MAG: divalent metal cation transporter [Acidobacteria bacterium]|nr:divalent metal cation transporter [Acidobacteriota bacterium]
MAKRFERTGRWVVAILVAAFMAANLLNIAANLVAIGSGMNLLHAGPVWIWALVAGGFITTSLIMGSYDKITLVFKYLEVSLLV